MLAWQDQSRQCCMQKTTQMPTGTLIPPVERKINSAAGVYTALLLTGIGKQDTFPTSSNRTMAWRAERQRSSKARLT
jgi:hypothetical protein